MDRLEDEFRHILTRDTVPLRLSSLSSLAAEIGDAATEFLNDDVNDNTEDVSSVSYSRHIRGRLLALVMGNKPFLGINPDKVIDFREIVDQMIQAGQEQECCQVYCSVRRDVLDDCLVFIGVEKLSIEKVQRMESNIKMGNWIRALKLVVGDLLSDEKRLCDQIFGGSDLIKEVCFLETSEGCLTQLLHFGEAVAIGRSADKLFGIVDMYEALTAVLPDLQGLFMDGNAGDMVCSEVKGVLDALGEAAVGNFVEFENAVQGKVSGETMPTGAIHPFTRYVMNYAKLVADYGDTLNSLFGDCGG